MSKHLILCALLLIPVYSWSDPDIHNLQIEVKRNNSRYQYSASFNTPLNPCAAFTFLTDYEAAKQMPGVVESQAYREGPNHARVERTAEENILFFHVRLKSVMEYTEYPYQGVSYIQLSGDSKFFSGSWEIQPETAGTLLKLKAEWEPDTVIPLFIIDYFAKNRLVQKFNFMAQMAEKRKEELTARCLLPNTATPEQHQPK